MPKLDGRRFNIPFYRLLHLITIININIAPQISILPKNVKWMDYYNRIPELSQCLRLSCLLWRLDLLEKRITKEDLNRRQWHRNWSHNVNVALN